jgi:lysophospholipid acyltransferase (LPLAT)-like uncharacterized protein
VEVVRGSSSRGGSTALKQLLRSVRGRGSSPVIVTDGPRGPIYRCKPGLVVLGQMTGAPILPVAGVASSAWRLRSWDRLIVPRPFARLDVAFGEPYPIPRSGADADRETVLRRIDGRLDATCRRAGADPTQGSQR